MPTFNVYLSIDGKRTMRRRMSATTGKVDEILDVAETFVQARG